MTVEIPGRSNQWHGPALMAAVHRVVHLDKQDRAFKIRVAFFGLALLMGATLGALVVHVPSLYLFLGVGGVVFGLLLLFKIEIAIMLAILLRDWLGQFNYLGGDTPFHPNGVIGLVIIGAAGAFFLLKRRDLSRLRAFWLSLAFAAIYLASLLWTAEHRMEGLTAVLRLLTGLAMYAVLVYKLDSIKKIKWLIVAVFIPVVVRTAEGLVHVAQGGGMDLEAAEIVRIGTSGIGALLAMILAFCLVHFLEASTARQRLLWGIVNGFFALGLLFSYGRAGWIGFTITVVVIGLMKRSKLLIVFPIVLILLITLVPTVTKRFADIDLERLDAGADNTLVDRIEMWRESAEVWATQPWLGVGYGAGRSDVGEQSARFASMLHNDYMMVLVQTGIIGLIVFLLWHGQWLVELLKVRRTARYAYDKTLALAAFALFFASLIVSITDNVIEAPDKLYPLVALVAAALALPRIRAEEEARSAVLELSKEQPDDRRSRMLEPETPTSSQLPGEGLQQRLPLEPEILASATVAQVDQTRGVLGESAASAEISMAGQKQEDLLTVASVAVGYMDHEPAAVAAVSMPERNQEDILTVARGGGVAFVGEAATRGIHWVYSTALIWGLGPESFGMFTLALAITTFVGVIANLGLSHGIVRFGAINARDEGLSGIHRATMAGLRITVPAGLVIMLGLLLGADFLAVSIFKKPELAPLIRTLGLGVPLVSLQASLLAGTVAHKIMRYTVIVSIVQPLTALVLAIPLMALGYGVQAAALAFVVSYALGAGLALYYYLRMIPRKYRTRKRFSLREMFKFSLPLALNNLLNYTNQRTEVFFLGLLPAAISVGIYNIAWSISGTETMFVGSLSAIISPFTSDLSHRRAISQLESLYKTTAKWAFTGALMAFLIFVFSAPTIMNVFDPAYVAGAGVLIALGFARLLGSATGSAGTVLIMSGRSDLSLLNTIIILVTSIGLDWLLIARYGLPGAALAGALTVTLADLLRVVEVWLTLKIHPFTWSIAKPIVGGLLGLAVVYALRAAVGLQSLWIEMVYWAVFAVIYLAIIYLLKLDAEDMLVLSALRRRVGAFRVARART